MKSINMYDIIVDGIIPSSVINETIAITNNMACNICTEIGQFVPMFSNDTVWHCVQCWEGLGNDMSDNMRVKLNELSKNIQYNHAIRNI